MWNATEKVRRGHVEFNKLQRYQLQELIILLREWIVGGDTKKPVTAIEQVSHDGDLDQSVCYGNERSRPTGNVILKLHGITSCREIEDEDLKIEVNGGLLDDSWVQA